MCEGLGASLPLPRNEKEDTDLYAAVQSLGSLGRVALGATDVETEGIWVDSNGDSLTYFNWHTDGTIVEPNNQNGIQHFMLYLPMYNGKWGDRNGKVNVDVVCQKPELTSKCITSLLHFFTNFKFFPNFES